jgi:hypothetical protein
VKVQELGETLFRTSVPSPSIVAARKYCPFYGRNETLASLLKCRVLLVYCKFIVNSNIVVSVRHEMEMKRRLEDDEIERQLKCK